jgi:transposase-like protein
VPVSKKVSSKKRRHYTEKQKQRALELYGSMSVSALSKKLKIPKSTLGTWAKAAGLKTDRAEHVQAAVKARQADFAARRQALQENLLGDAEELRKRLWEPCIAYNFGGRDNTYRQRKQKEPDYRAKEQICKGVGTLVTSIGKLAEIDDKHQDRTEVDLFLEAMKGKR